MIKEMLEKEKEDIERAELMVKDLEEKWFKTTANNEKITFLKKYIEIKDKLVKELE